MEKLMKLLMIGCFFVGFSDVSIAQTYGGSASVNVKDKDGNSRLIVTTTDCIQITRTKAKEQLKYLIESKKQYYEEFTTSIDYDIDECNRDDYNNYGGSASIEVQNKKNKNTRIINVTTQCVQVNKVKAKTLLLYAIEYKTQYDEIFISDLSFDIESCN